MSLQASASQEEGNNRLFELEQRGSGAIRQFLTPSWLISQFADVRSPTDIRLYLNQLAQNREGVMLRVRICLGFTRDERFCNVALTRATSASIVPPPQTVAESAIKLRNHDVRLLFPKMAYHHIPLNHNVQS